MTHAPVVLDTAGPELSADDRRRIQHPLTGGLILFGRHWSDRSRLTALVAEVSIGHAIAADALEFGMAETVRAYQRCIRLAQAPGK